MLLHTEYSLLSLLHTQDGVVHHHGLFQVSGPHTPCPAWHLLKAPLLHERPPSSWCVTPAVPSLLTVKAWAEGFGIRLGSYWCYSAQDDLILKNGSHNNIEQPGWLGRATFLREKRKSFNVPHVLSNCVVWLGQARVEGRARARSPAVGSHTVTGPQSFCLPRYFRFFCR